METSTPLTETEVSGDPKSRAYAQLYWLAAGHLMLDAYTGSVSVFLPILITKFQLSITLGAILLTAYSIIASLGQLPFGFLADRFPRVNFTVWGLVFAGICISSLGLAPFYWVAFVLLILAGFSTSLFHPQAAAMSGEAAKRSRSFGLAVFMTAGRTGYALGPLMMAPVAAYFGPEYIVLFAVPALIIALAIRRHWQPTQVSKPWPGRAAFLKPFTTNFRPLALIWSLEAMRTSVMTGVSSFLPLLLIQKGYSLVAAGAAVSLFVGAGAVGNLVGGRLADRIGRRRLLLVSMSGAIPLAYGFLWTSGPVSWILLPLLGAVLLSTLGVTIAVGQELVPENANTVSSLMMGVTWTVGSVGLLIIGVLADWIGLTAAIGLLFLMLVPAAAFAWYLPPDRERFSN
jgi:FSR family fosmidomycin resistance protein-like MFS transporter